MVVNARGETSAYVRERTGLRGGWAVRVVLGASSNLLAEPAVAINSHGAGIVVFNRGGDLVAFRRARAHAPWVDAVRLRRSTPTRQTSGAVPR